MSDVKFSKEHEWLKMDGDIATIGITKHATEMLGDIVFVELPDLGSNVEKDGNAGVVESTKAASDVYTPVSGEVVENNQAIFDPLLVAEGKRNTWVFTYLVYSVVKDLIASGVVDGNALVHADNRKIMALMQKIGAKMGKEDALYRLDLTQGEG